MQHLREQPRPEYLKAQTECTCTGSDKTQASNPRRGEGLCSFPTGGERACWPCADAVAPRLGWGEKPALDAPPACTPTPALPH